MNNKTINLIPNISAPTYTLSAVVIGVLLIDDLTPSEQNSLGNWFMLLAQVLCTNAAQQQLLNNRNKTSNVQNQSIVNDNNSESLSLEEIQNILNKMQKQINNLKQNN